MIIIDNNEETIVQAYRQNKSKVIQGKFVLIREGIEHSLCGCCKLADGKFYVIKSTQEHVLLLSTDTIAVKD